MSWNQPPNRLPLGERATNATVTYWNSLPAALAPIAFLIPLLAFCLFMALVDPNGTSAYPKCPFYLATGKWCPGCGTARGLHTLFRGNVGAAVSYNVLLVIAVPVGLYSYASWATKHMKTKIQLPQLRLPTWGIVLIVPVIFAFWILRNVSVAPFSWLAP